MMPEEEESVTGNEPEISFTFKITTSIIPCILYFAEELPPSKSCVKA